MQTNNLYVKANCIEYMMIASLDYDPVELKPMVNGIFS